jgi:hypothetical protein
MKIFIIVLSILSFIAINSCTKVESKEMTIIRDCTGTYLRIDSLDYHICNIEIAKTFASGTKVNASYSQSFSCQNNQIVCYMLHQNQGWIEITTIY